MGWKNNPIIRGKKTLHYAEWEESSTKMSNGEVRMPLYINYDVNEKLDKIDLNSYKTASYPQQDHG